MSLGIKIATLSIGILTLTFETIKANQPVDEHDLCCFWASKDQCQDNPFWMRTHCQISCGTHLCNLPERCGGLLESREKDESSFTDSSSADGSIQNSFNSFPADLKSAEDTSVDSRETRRWKPSPVRRAPSPPPPPPKSPSAPRPTNDIDPPKSVVTRGPSKMKALIAARARESQQYSDDEVQKTRDNKTHDYKISSKRVDPNRVRTAEPIGHPIVSDDIDDNLQKRLEQQGYLVGGTDIEILPSDEQMKEIAKDIGLDDGEDSEEGNSFEAILKHISELDISQAIESKQPNLIPPTLTDRISEIHDQTSRQQQFSNIDDSSDNSFGGFEYIGSVGSSDKSQPISIREIKIANNTPQHRNEESRKRLQNNRRLKPKSRRNSVSPVWSHVWPAWPFIRSG